MGKSNKEALKAVKLKNMLSEASNEFFNEHGSLNSYLTIASIATYVGTILHAISKAEVKTKEEIIDKFNALLISFMNQPFSENEYKVKEKDNDGK